MNPHRLSLARRKRGLTKKRLAEKSGLGSRTITAYESGEIEASPEGLEKLARALEFPVAFFEGDDLNEPEVDASTFRSLSRMTRRQRDSALASGALGFHLADWIEASFNLPTQNVPDYGEMDDPETAADRLRSDWGLGWGPIASMVKLLESKGVFILSLSGCAREVDAFSTWHGDRPFVLLNPSKTAERSRMDCAHELAHLVLHRHRNVRRRDVEQEAKIFAGSFLLPRSGVKPTARRQPSLSSVLKDKQRWRVSALAYVVRLSRLDMLTEWHYRTLCMQLRQFGASEPYGIQREQSVMLDHVLGTLRQEGISRSSLAEKLCISRDDLDALLYGLVMTGLRGEGAGSSSRAKPELRLVK